MHPQKLHWRYKNLSFLVLGLVAGILLYKSELFRSIILDLGFLGYLGAFLAGLLYDSTFTVATSIAILLILADKIPLLLLTLIATCGAVLGDYLMFRFVKDGLIEELKPVAKLFEYEIGKKRVLFIKHLVHSRYFHWTLPVVAAIMVGSPFPNELAIIILGAAGVRTRSLLSISLVFNFLGIITILWGHRMLST